jgi:hypothetical protein
MKIGDNDPRILTGVKDKALTAVLVADAQDTGILFVRVNQHVPVGVPA